MSRFVHVIIGPDEHGVVRHASHVAAACAHDVLRTDGPAEAVTAIAAGEIAGADVVHLPFTDRLFAATCEQAARAFVRLADTVRAGGASVSVTLHDVPHGDDAWSVRRRAAYREVIGVARGVVVNSREELRLVQDEAWGVHSLRCIALPVDRTVDGAGDSRPVASPAGDEVAVLGFLFPDRGYEQVLHALPPGAGLVALGRAAAGHEDLPGRYATLAGDLGRRWRMSGFVPDEQLPAALAGAAVPIAPNTRVTASASIGSWLAHGRRPLVPDVPYTRELSARMPGTLRLYQPDELADAIAGALADPATTWLAPDARVGPSTTNVSHDYADHLQACVPAERRSAGEPPTGNRWDLLLARHRDRGRISVVVPYFESQRSLDLVLAALAGQTVADRTEIIVADDGSTVPPDTVAAGACPVRIVRQERRGFGAARARNLGASVATGSVLAFLDADTVPEPDFVERLTRLPETHPDAMTVGRRRHADLDGWTHKALGEWFAGRRDGPRVLDEPRWLRDAYRASNDLLHADARSYRFVISAVLAVHRSLFERIGGFDERFEHYGGEDWELAHRAWLAGALLAHVPAAVAWHDGPDWAGRGGVDHRAAKNAELLTLSRLLPDPVLRGGGQWLPYVHTVVEMAADDPADVLRTARSAFAAGADCGVRLTGPEGMRIASLLADPRIQAGPPPPDVYARASVVVEVHAACDLRDLPRLAALAAERGVVRTPACTARSTRALNRVRGRTADRDAPVDELLVEQLFGRHDRFEPVPAAPTNLERDLTRLASP